MVELRDYQQDAVNRFLKVRKGIVATHPGSGKTVIACSAINEVFRREGPDTGKPSLGPPSGKSVLALVIVPTLVLLDQWNDELEKQNVHSTTVITYARACKLAFNDRFWAGFSILVFDEVHHLAEGRVYQRLLVPAFKAKYALGLTSTPPTNPNHILLRVLPVLATMDFAEGRQKGFAAPVEVRPVPVSLAPDEAERYADLTHSIAVRFKRLGVPLAKAMQMKNRDAAELKAFIAQRRFIVATAVHKVGAVLGILEDIRKEAGDTARVFIWNERIVALQVLQSMMESHGMDAPILSGETPKEVRKNLLARWGKDFYHLLVAKVGEEGLDAPEVAYGIITAGSRTNRQNVQRVGRLMRPQPGKTAQLYVVYAQNTVEEKLLSLIQQVLG